MTSMKDYADKKMNDVTEADEEYKERQAALLEAFWQGCCPHCNGTDFVVRPKRTENGLYSMYYCLECLWKVVRRNKRF
jgi:hypothetical protein